MKLNKQQKILFTVLGGAVLLFVVDTLQRTSNPEKQAPAPEPVAVAAADTLPPMQLPASSSPAAPVNSDSPAEILRRLGRTAGIEQVASDGFSPLSIAPAKLTLTPSAPTESYRLTATFLSGDSSSVIVNGRLIRRGQSIGRFVLTSVQQKSAVFRSGNELMTLSLTD